MPSSPLQEFVYVRTYSRWRDDLKRREKWEESVERLINFFNDELPKVSPSKYQLSAFWRNKLQDAITRQQVMPSMRALWAAGDAARSSHVTMYNCAYTAVDDVAVFSELLYILMCGTGAGFSVEQLLIYGLPVIDISDDIVEKLPTIKPEGTGKTIKIVVQDSKEGWARALDRAMRALYKGHDIDVDYSLVRPRGARLKTMGGRASGPEPLMKLMEYLVKKFRVRRGQKLQSIDVHDIICMIADIVVVGGVRRSSLISLSDLNDAQMALAKTGDFQTMNPQRFMANNSAVYNGRPPMAQFMQEWMNLAASGSGERGIFNRDGALKHMTANGRRKRYLLIGMNPCGEIILRSCEFCNLSSVPVRAEDTLETLKEKVKMATVLGAIQSCFTDFPFLRDIWKKNCDEERLLGVSLNGIMDHPVLNHVNDTAKVWLSELKHVAISTAKKWSRILGINMSAAITCVKPEGTGSQLLNTASGIHLRDSEYYIRRVRISATDPLFRLVRDQGVPVSPENGQDPQTASTWVVSFPVASPKGAKTKKDVTAIEQLEHWKMVREFWCEHNPSCTVYVAEHEWMKVGAWVYENFDYITGLSFFPKNDDHVYQQPPYEEITQERYEELFKAFPVIDYSKLSDYELEDNTDGAKSYACSGDKCELV